MSETKPAFSFKVVDNVTLTLMKFGDKPCYIRAESEFYKGKVVDDKKEAPTMFKVTDLQTGELHEAIAGTVMVGNMTEKYPDSFKGRCFSIRKISPEGARKYSLFEIAEIKVEEPAAESKKAK